MSDSPNPSPADYRRERIARGLTQADLAALVGVARNTIIGREVGKPGYPINREAWLALLSLPGGKKPRRRGPAAFDPPP